MKQLKFLMVALTLLMGISFTSCLNSSESESAYDWGGFVLVKSTMGFTYFEDAAGNTMYPTTASVSQVEANGGIKISDSRLAFIYIKLVETEADKAKDANTGTTTPKKYDVNLLSFLPCNYNTPLVAATNLDMTAMAPETAPVISLALSDGYIQWKPFLFNLDMVILPIAWRLEKNESAIVNKHKLVLACSMEEVESGDKELVFYLRHDKGDDDKTTIAYSSFYGYNIVNAIEQFKAKAGAAPTKIIIKAHESGQNSNDIPNNYTEYSIDYKMAE